MTLYETKGVAVLNQVGFFTAAEECFQLIDKATKSGDRKFVEHYIFTSTFF
jgi:hypothetical protein